MTDKNLIDLTNEDIISSLEVIATTHNCNECKIRNCKWGTCNCEQITANAALNLINRQKAEIERLQKEVNLVSIQFQDLQERYEEHREEIERLKEFIVETRRCDKEIKSEAIKEFAERLKEKSFKTIRNYGLTKDVVEVCDIDNLVKDMIGEKE